MKKRAFVVGFGLIVAAAALSQQPAWKIEHHDTMLVPPKAAHVTFIEKGTQDELTYTVDELYPAAEFLHGLCEELRVRSWTPSGHGGCPNPEWMKIPTPSRDQYELVLVWNKWENNNWEHVSYDLKYTNAKNEHYLRTLHVDTYARNSPAVAPQPTLIANPGPAGVLDRLLRLGLILLYLFLLIATVLLLAFAKLRTAVFYGGPSAWLTGINLVLFGPVLVSFLSLGGVMASAVWPAREDIPGSGVLLAAVGLWLILAACSRIGYVAIPIVLLLTPGILFAKGIPQNVKIAHGVLAFLTLSFFVVCIAFFSGPLIRW